MQKAEAEMVRKVNLKNDKPQLVASKETKLKTKQILMILRACQDLRNLANCSKQSELRRQQRMNIKHH